MLRLPAVPRGTGTLNVAAILRVAAVLALPVLGGCAQNLDLGILYAAPGKYDYLRCEDLPARLASAISREKQLGDLIARANQEPGGQVVSSAAYSADLAQARAEQKMLRQTAVDKNCGSIEAPPPGAAPTPVPAAPPPRTTGRPPTRTQ